MLRSLHAGVSLPTVSKAAAAVPQTAAAVLQLAALLPLWLGCAGGDDGSEPSSPTFVVPGCLPLK